MKLRYSVLIAMLFALNLAAQQPMNHNSVVEINENEVKFKENKILLKLHEEYSDFDLSTGGVSNSPIAEIQALNDEFGVTSIQKLFPFVKKINNQPHDLTTIYEIEYTSEISPLEVAQRYSEILEVEFAEPDYIASILLVPNDPYYDDGSQWYHDDVKAEDAWDLSTGDATQIIGIIDTGVDWQHEDLSDNIWVNQAELDGDEGVDDDNNGFVDDIRGWDFVNDDNNPMDDNSHGTHVAGIAGAKTNNNLGIAGIAWNAKLMPIKVLQSSGRGSWSDIAQGAAYAVENGSTVLNMSLGGYSESLTLKTALENAYHYSVLVAAAGNDGLSVDGAPVFPACYNWVLGVMASNKYGSRVGWSNYDPSGPNEVRNPYGYNYEVLAPGANIYSSIPGNEYRYLSGTSMATPVLAGAICLIKSHLPNESTENIFARLIQSTDNGILDIEAAMTISLIPDLRLVKFDIIDTLDGCENDGKPDAGETFEMSIRVKNYGGWAQNVKAKISLGEFEDSTMIDFIDTVSVLQNISSYAQVTSDDNPFKLSLPSHVVHNRDVVLHLEITAENWQESYESDLIITAENGYELSGYHRGLLRLTADKSYLVSNDFRVDSLILDPGVVFNVASNKAFDVLDYLLADGKPDSVITLSKQPGDIGNPNNYIYNYCNFNVNFEYGLFNHCVFNKMTSKGSGTTTFSLITNSSGYYNNSSYHRFYNSVFAGNNNFRIYNRNYFVNNTITGNKMSSDFQKWLNNQYIIGGSWENKYQISPNYFGTQDSLRLEEVIYDFNDDFYEAETDKSKVLKKPGELPHGHVWQTLIDDINTYDDEIEPIGNRSIKFDVFFNRAMDTSYTPFVTFGVREPYTQKAVTDSAKWISWNLDSVRGETVYHLQVSKDKEFTDIIYENNNLKSLEKELTLNEGSRYFWRVRYKNSNESVWKDWADAKSFQTKLTRVPHTLNIIFPQEEDSVNTEFFGLIEENIFCDSLIFQVATDNNFQNIIQNDSLNFRQKIWVGNLNSNSSYYLRIKGHNKFGWNDWTQPVKFKTKHSNEFLPPVPVSPINNDSIGFIQPYKFKWTYVPWATKYLVEASRYSNFSQINYRDTSFTNFHEISSISTLLKFWRVKAYNEEFESDWSQTGEYYQIKEAYVRIFSPSGASVYCFYWIADSLSLSQIDTLPDGRYYYSIDNEIDSFVVNRTHCQLNIPIDNEKWVDTNITLKWNNGPKANTIYNARWQAYHTVDYTTGDGLNWVRVANARDNEGFEIPVDLYRFGFEVQATAALSSEFIANGDVGKINLEWGLPDADRDVLGFNLYRFVKTGEGTWGDTVKVNNYLIMDTTFTDVNVIPDSTYYYVYRILRTTLDEADDSKMVSAKAYPEGLDAPELLYPPNDTTKLPVNLMFHWGEPSGANTYVFQLATDFNFDNIIVDNEDSLSNYHAIGLSNRMKYYWRVKAIGVQGASDWSEIRNFETLPVIPDVPSLIAPEHNSIGQPLSVNFDWGSANEADSYQIQVADDPGFGNIWSDISGITASFKSIGGLAVNKFYYWRVRSKNDAGLSAWSNIWRFKTDTAGATPPPDTWNFTDYTGNNSTLVVPHAIKPRVNGRDILTGDAIGVFYKENDSLICGGYAIWEGNNLAITIWGDDDQTQVKDGFDVNDGYIIKVWDSRDQKQFDVIVTYATGNDYYTINGYSVLGNLESYSDEYFIMPIRQGWNIISCHIIPDNDSIPAFFEAVEDDLVIVKNKAGQTYIPQFGIDNIKNWKYQEAYQAYASEADNLVVDGTPVVPELDSMTLESGWNYFAYLRKSALNIEEALSSIDDDILIVKNNEGKLYLPQFSINTIGEMMPGQGYLGYLTAERKLSYPPNSSSRAATSPRTPLAKTLVPEHSITGSDMTLILHAEVSEGSEAGVYDESGRLIGGGAFQNGVAAITVWGDDVYTDGKDGAGDNELLTVKVLQNGELFRTKLSYNDKGRGIFSSFGYAKNAILECRVEELITSQAEIRISPEPVSESLHLEILNLDGGKTIEIRNLLGSSVFTLNSGKNVLDIDCSGFPAGTYFVVVSNGEDNISSKFIKLK